MFTKFKFTSGFPKTQLKLTKEFSFVPGINIVLGRNGSGKSVLLKSMARVACVGKQGGWSKYLDAFDLSIRKRQSKQYVSLSNAEGLAKFYHDCLCETAPGNERLKATKQKTKPIDFETDWNGYPAFLFDPQVVDAPIVDLSYDKDNSKLMGEGPMDKLIMMSSGHSRGQLRIIQMMNLAKAIRNAPDLIKKPDNYKQVNDQRKFAIDAFIEYVKYNRKLYGKNGKRITLLMDETDSGLDMINQIDFWTKLIPEWAASACQIIIATHNVLSLKVKNAHFLETEPGFIKKLQSSMG